MTRPRRRETASSSSSSDHPRHHDDESHIISSPSLLFSLTPRVCGLSVRCEAALNAQIEKEQDASALYEAMHAFFGRAAVALPGFAALFARASDEERGHARRLMEHVNVRGGRVRLQRTSAWSPFFEPEVGSGSGDAALLAMKTAMDVERANFRALVDLRALAEREGDACLSDFLGEALLTEQVRDMYDLALDLSRLTRLCGDGGVAAEFGVQQFDRALLEKYGGS